MSIILPGDIPVYNVTNVQPFTEKDGRTYLQILMDLRKYLNTTLVDGINTNTAELMAWVNTAIANMEAGVVNDSSFLAVVSDVDGETRLYLDSLYLGQTTTDGDVRTFVLDVDGLTRVALDGLYAGQRTTNADVAAYIDDDEGATREALDTLYAGQGATDGQVNALVENPASATRSSLNDLYAGQAATDAGVAVFVTGPGDTRTALDGLYAGQGATDDSVNGLIEDEGSDTRTTLDSLYGGSSSALDDEVSALIVNPASDTRVQLDGLYTGGGGGGSIVTADGGLEAGDDITDTGTSKDNILLGSDIVHGDTVYDVVIGGNAKAFNAGAGVAIGELASIGSPPEDVDDGGYSHVAIGHQAHTGGSGSGTMAVGYQSNTVGAGSLSVGFQAENEGDYSLSVGPFAKSDGPNAVSIGRSSEASDNGAIAIGYGPHATGDGSVAVGSTAYAEGVNSLAIGANSSASGDNAIALGQNASASGERSIAIGVGTSANDDNTIVIQNGIIRVNDGGFPVTMEVLNNVMTFNGATIPWGYQPGTNDDISQGFTVIEQREIIQFRTYIDGGGNWVSTPVGPVARSGHLSDMDRVGEGFMYFNTTLGMPVWLKTKDPAGIAHVWVDATGTVVP